MRKWGHLPELKIVDRLLTTSATTRSIAVEYGCSDSTIKAVFRRHTTEDQRIAAKHRKGREKKRGRQNPQFAKWRKENDVWTGRKHSRSAKEKQSKAKKGRRISMSQRIAISAKQQDISVSDWKGFVTAESERMRKSKKWRQWREAVFRRDNWTCQDCGVRGGELHPHHIESKATRPELMFDVQNGQALCVECHKKTETYGKHSRCH